MQQWAAIPRGSWLACECIDAVFLNNRVNFFAGKPAPTGLWSTTDRFISLRLIDSARHS